MKQSKRTYPKRSRVQRIALLMIHNIAEEVSDHDTIAGDGFDIAMAVFEWACVTPGVLAQLNRAAKRNELPLHLIGEARRYVKRFGTVVADSNKI